MSYTHYVGGSNPPGPTKMKLSPQKLGLLFGLVYILAFLVVWVFQGYHLNDFGVFGYVLFGLFWLVLQPASLFAELGWLDWLTPVCSANCIFFLVNFSFYVVLGWAVGKAISLKGLRT